MKDTCSKTKEIVINRKFNACDIEYRIYISRETEFFHIFTCAKHDWKYKKFCLNCEINSIFNVKPLNILYTIEHTFELFWFLWHTSSVSIRHHSNNIHMLFLYMNWYQHVLDEVTKTCYLTTLYNRNQTINMDKRRHCWLSKVSSCKTLFHYGFGMIEYSSVLCKLSKLPGHFANHFLSMMYWHHHELI